MGSSQHRKIIEVFLLASLPAILSQGLTAVRAEQLPIKTYTTADGLADDRVNRIVQDSHGLLWFCTAEGLSHFDGYKFTNYTKANGLTNDFVTDLLETRDGTYLVGTQGGGLFQFNPKGSPLFRPLNRLVSGFEFIHQLLEDRAGVIWCATWGGLYRLERAGDEWRFDFVDLGLTKETSDSWAIDSLMEDAAGSLWVGTRGSGLCRYHRDGRVERFTAAKGLPPNGRITALLQDRGGRVWVGTPEGLCRLVSDPGPERPVVARLYTVKDGLADNWIDSLFQSSNGKVVVGNRGISEFIAASDTDQPQFRSYTAAEGLNQMGPAAIAEDRDGNLWLGTVAGAMKVARIGFYRFGHHDGLDTGEIVSIFEDKKGVVCTFMRDRQARQFIARFNGQRFDSVRVQLPPSIRYTGWGVAQVALQDRGGDWWVATGEGLCRFPPTRESAQPAQARPSAIYTTVNGLATDDIFRVFEDSQGNIWMGTASKDVNGLTRWERSTDSVHTYTEADGLPGSPLPLAFGEDHAGCIWVGLNRPRALARYTGGLFNLFTDRDGAPSGAIAAIHCDHLGRLWVSAEQGGVSRIDDPGAARPRFVNYTTAQGLSSNQVLCITEDNQGRLYFGTGHGLDRLDPSTGRIKHYTAADGLFPGRVRYAFRDQSGALWFGNESELSRFIPEPDRPQPVPAILIQGLRIAGAASPISELGQSQVGPLRLGVGQNMISIDFASVELEAGDVLRYQYKLESSDRDWSAPTDQRTINYANLAPGSYRFLVRAVTAEGVVSSQPAVVAFTIPPPLYLRWWFVMLTAAALAMLAYAAHRYRVARLVQLERVRTRIATDLHDDIGSSLSRMALLSEVAKRKMDGSQNDSIPILTEIADSARAVVDSMSDIVWAIDPRLDDLSNVVFRVRQFASDLLGSAGIQWQLAAQPEFDKVKLSPQQRRQLFLIFKEAINNAARHAACNSVWLNLIVVHNQVIGEIRDDGRGFAVDSLPQIPGDGRGGHGLENIRKRAAQLGGQLTINSSPGRGTTIKAEFPLKQAWHEHAMVHGRKIR